MVPDGRDGISIVRMTFTLSTPGTIATLVFNLRRPPFDDRRVRRSRVREAGRRRSEPVDEARDRPGPGGGVPAGGFSSDVPRGEPFRVLLHRVAAVGQADPRFGFFPPLGHEHMMSPASPALAYQRPRWK